jgi:membrane protein implicated in regulation of membrane protease activity
MSDWLMWLLLGGALCVAELFSGTFYLLLLGMAAFAAAGGAWVGLPGSIQFALAALVSLAGLPLVRRATRRRAPPAGNYDSGQEIELAEVNGQLQGLYSGSFWRVHEVSGQALRAGDRVRIVRVDGSRLIVAAPPADRPSTSGPT